MLDVITKQIFMYWTGSSIPDEIKQNIVNFKNVNKDFNVKIINDSDFLELATIDFPKLINLFNKINIPTCKSDIARLLFLYYYGGIYIDCNTVPNKNFEDFYELNKHHDFILSFNYINDDYSTRILFSKPKSLILKDILINITTKLESHYINEKNFTGHVEYSILLLTGTGPFYDVLGRNNSKQLFNIYNIGLFDDNSDIVRHYQCNMNHHHLENFHKHWSNLQKTEKLFIN